MKTIVRIVPKSNRKAVETKPKKIPVTHKNMAAHSPGLVQSGGIKMFYGPNIPYQWNDAFMQLLLACKMLI